MTPELIRYAKAAVKRGVKLLDKIDKGWDKEIDLRRLDLSSPDHCMLGQLYFDPEGSDGDGDGHYNGYTRGISALEAAREVRDKFYDEDDDDEIDPEVAAKYGFEAPDKARGRGLRVEYFSFLTELWTNIIEQCRKKDVTNERKRRVAGRAL